MLPCHTIRGQRERVRQNWTIHEACEALSQADLGVAPRGRAQRQHSEVRSRGGHLAYDVHVGVVTGASMRLQLDPADKVHGMCEGLVPILTIVQLKRYAFASTCAESRLLSLLS